MPTFAPSPQTTGRRGKAARPAPRSAMASIWDGISGIARRKDDSRLSLHETAEDDLDLNCMEAGTSKICIDPLLLKPSRCKKQWEKYYFTKSLCGTKFKLYKDNQSKDYALSGWIVNKNELRISQFEMDCNDVYSQHKDKFIFVLKRDHVDAPLRLYTVRECEMCDGLLGLGCCSSDETRTPPVDAEGPQERQLLCVINHGVVPIFGPSRCTAGGVGGVDHDARVMDISLPGFHGNFDRRDCWCRRGQRMKEIRRMEEEKRNRSHAYAMHEYGMEDSDAHSVGAPARRDSKTSSVFGSDDDSCSTLSDDKSHHGSLQRHKFFQCNELSPIKLSCKVPQWNQKVGSLVMDFVGNRVKVASSKNFLMYISSKGSSEKSNPVLQVGKYRSKRYNLDIKEPLSTVQGFCNRAKRIFVE